MNRTIRGTVEAIALKVEGKDNPIRMCQLTLAVPTESQEEAESAAGPRLAIMAYGSSMIGPDGRTLAYKSIKPTLAFGVHYMELTEDLKFRVQPVIHEIRADETIDIVYRFTFPLAGNQPALLYLAESLGAQIACTLSAAQQELPLESAKLEGLKLITLTTKSGSVSATPHDLRRALDAVKAARP
jgi:hypothetical protein